MVRITDEELPNTYLNDGEILTADQINVLVTLLKGGVNANYSDIQEILASLGLDGGSINGLKFTMLFVEPEVKEAGMLFYRASVDSLVFINSDLEEIIMNSLEKHIKLSEEEPTLKLEGDIWFQIV